PGADARARPAQRGLTEPTAISTSTDGPDAVTDSPDELITGIRTGDRRSLARAITLVESTRGDHRDEATAVLDAVLPATGGAVRIGISGAPGVGKSTFIEAFGL